MSNVIHPRFKCRPRPVEIEPDPKEKWLRTDLDAYWEAFVTVVGKDAAVTWLGFKRAKLLGDRE